MSLIIILFSIGIFLLAAEVMIPGGILGIGGGVMLFTGCALSFVMLGTMEGLIAIGASLLAAFIVFYIQFKILPNTRAGKRFFLEKQISGTSAAGADEMRDLIGKTATSVTVLSPSGYVTVEGERFEAFSQSGQIAAGAELVITGANHFQIFVRTKQ